MTLLITGGAGYIGSHAVYAALDAGEKVAVVDDLSTGVRENLPPSLPFYQGDVGDAAFITDVLRRLRPQSVMHFAGSIVVPESVENPLKYYQNNTVASLTLLRSCVEAGVENFVFSSTAAVYGLPPDGVADEDAPIRPINPYGASKAMIEQMIRDVAQAHGLRYGILRYFNVAGADALGRTGQGSKNVSHLIKVACQVATGRRARLEIFGTDYPTPDGTCIRDYIHVSDLADAHMGVLGALVSKGESMTLNCGVGHGYSVREVVRAVEEEMGGALPVVDAPPRAGDPPMLISRSHRLRKNLGWNPRHPGIEDMVRSALRWESGAVAASD